jgi:TetR/AcrR family transcriptional regulator, regulator of autoinduction and epiphytic fitness
VALRQQIDGRTARSERTRAAVADALLDLIDEGELQPPAQAVAERAGVSLRIVYHHFDDLTTLFAAAGARQSERVMALVKPISDEGSFPARLEAFVAQRARLYHRIFNARRAARLLEHASPVVADTLQLVRAYKRVEAERVFARELAKFPPSRRRERSDALGAVSSFNSWESLRTHQQLSVEDSRRVLSVLITAVLKED